MNEEGKRGSYVTIVGVTVSDLFAMVRRINNKNFYFKQRCKRGQGAKVFPGDLTISAKHLIYSHFLL